MSLRSLVLVIPDEVGKYGKREVVVIAIGAVEQCNEPYNQEIVLEVLWFFHLIDLLLNFKNYRSRQKASFL